MAKKKTRQFDPQKKYGLVGQQLSRDPNLYPKIISGAKQSPDDPNVIRGDTQGAWVGPQKQTVMQKFVKMMARKKRKNK